MNLQVKRLELSGVLRLEPKLWKDHRGGFFELSHSLKLQEAGIRTDFVQDNVSYSCAGTIRGMHYQLGKPQAKLVTCLQGQILDVAVDVRKGSPTFGHSISEVLRGDAPASLYVPEGFAHGFLVTSKSAIVVYKVTDYYSPADERGIVWNDPSVRHHWPESMVPVLSPRDHDWPFLAAAELPTYGAGA